MEPITEERRKALEKLARRKICPLMAEKISPYKGIFAAPREALLPRYYCSLDDNIARGGIPSFLVPGAACTPCSKDFAEHCPMYKMYVEEYR